MMRERFWERFSLDQLTAEEWEALCDGCAQCCRLKYQDAETDEILLTPVVCGLLETQSCRCTSYDTRHEVVADCVAITPSTVATFDWLPDTCAYRLLNDGEPLFDWHPLLSGSQQSVIAAGISVKGKVVSERDVDPEDLEFQAMKWVQNR